MESAGKAEAGFTLGLVGVAINAAQVVYGGYICVKRFGEIVTDTKSAQSHC